MNEEIVKRLFAEAESLSKNLVRVDSIVYDNQQELNNIEELYVAGKIGKSDYKKEKRRLQNVISTKSEIYRSLRERFDQIESDYSKYEKDAKTKNDNPIKQSDFEIYENELRGKYLNTVEQQEPSKKKKANYIIPIAVVAAIAIAYTSYVAGAKSHDGNIISISQKKDEKESDTVKEENNTENSVKDYSAYPYMNEEKKNFESKYGKLTDATDDVQVERIARGYYEEYFKQKLDEIDRVVSRSGNKNNPIYRKQCTIENLSNIIRMRNNVLPKEDGVEIYDRDKTLFNYYSQMYNELFCNMPANIDYFSEVGFIPSSFMLLSNSEEQEFSMMFDEDYKDIADARNGKYKYNVEESIAKLGEHLRDRLLLRGLNGEMTPWNLKGNRYALIQDAMRKFSAYVISWQLSGQKGKLNAGHAVCIPVCDNYNTKEKEIWSVTKIYEAIEDGEYNDVIAYLNGSEPNEEPIGVQFFYEQDEKFYEQYYGKSYTKK